MKSKEEIEQLAENSSEVQEATYTTQHKITYKHGYIDGYTQCQEDVSKKLEELREAIRKNTWYDENGWAQVNLYGIDDKLLNKQD